ncbi:MAG TPA: GspE/PulE family protein [Candidatus Synoicihabitans sp.]|nr:GspE/PulE family protein [Candidatus Synoicihabitans sp.]
MAADPPAPRASTPAVVQGRRTPAARRETSATSVPPVAVSDPTSVTHLVDLVLDRAVRDRASDVHFEPFEHEFKIRYRVDGALYELTPPPVQLAVPVTSRLKVLANLNIAERRVPQDGRIKLSVAGRTVDLRISTLPTQFGESVVLRVLDRAGVQLELRELGLPAEMQRQIEEAVRRPHGLVIVTGPTGSGKTTTLYSALRAITTPELKVLTAEDPVEYEIDGIMQVAVQPDVGLTFESALRSFLRQDPDVIMVGEIRDLETARIAVQAALTGHLVLTTLHTNDAASAIARLLDMGVEPFLLSSALTGVLAQRLVRRLCPECCSAVVSTAEHWRCLPMAQNPFIGRPIFTARGCAACANTGYRGRTGLFEWLALTEELRAAVLEHASTQALRERAATAGLRPLRDVGIELILSGGTTIEEVARHC